MTRENPIFLSISRSKLGVLQQNSRQAINIGIMFGNISVASKLEPIIGKQKTEDAQSYTDSGINVIRIAHELLDNNIVDLSLEQTHIYTQPYITKIKSGKWSVAENGLRTLQTISAVSEKDCEKLLDEMLKGATLRLTPSITVLK